MGERRKGLMDDWIRLFQTKYGVTE